MSTVMFTFKLPHILKGIIRGFCTPIYRFNCRKRNSITLFEMKNIPLLKTKVLQIFLNRTHTHNTKPRHLICFKQWTPEMVCQIVESALNLKVIHCDTHDKRLDILENSKIIILSEVNRPILNTAISKAATFLGAHDVTVVDHLLWEKDYYGRFFSFFADAIFVATSTHMCVQRFSEHSTVPVTCIISRTHASLQSLATVMAIFEEFGTMKHLNIGYIGPAHPVLNSYLLLCPMLGANIKFKCSCNVAPVSPLLLKSSQDLVETTHTEVEQLTKVVDILRRSHVIISGPTTTNKSKIKEFSFKVGDIERCAENGWIYFHTCPRGEEIDDDMFNHQNARTFRAFDNMQYIAAALMASGIKGFYF